MATDNTTIVSKKKAAAALAVASKKKAAALAAAAKKKAATSTVVSKENADEAVLRTAAVVSSDSVSIDGHSSAEFFFSDRDSGGDDLATLAMRWSNILSRRFQWEQNSLDEIQKKAFEEIKELAKRVDIKPVLKDANVIEVKIPYVDEARGWEARVLPWEYLNSNAAKQFGKQNPLVIVRHLEAGAKVPFKKPSPKVLCVQSAPGKLADLYIYESE